MFYFPGCGSERLFSQVGLATQAMLYHVGAQMRAAAGLPLLRLSADLGGRRRRGQQIITDNRVLFHRVANTLNYLDIKTVIVSCGTCMDQLQKYEFGKIFPGCRLLDIHEYLMEKGVALEGVEGVRYMYHDPCHTPMKTYAPLEVVNELMGATVALNDRCCGESGTLATTRPGHLDAGALPQGGGDAQGRATALRADGFDGTGQGADVVPVVPAGPVALRRRRGDDGRLHRRRDRAAPARRELDGRLRGQGEPRRDRARAGLTAGLPRGISATARSSRTRNDLARDDANR